MKTGAIKNLNLNDVTDNKTFWQTIKPYFNEKVSGSDKIALSGNESVLTNEKEIANTGNNCFINITKHLNLKPHTTSNTMDIEQITSAFNNHVSIKKIRDVFPEINSNNFEFTKVTEQLVKNEVLKLNTKKSSTSGSTSATILKQSVETYLPFLTKAINLAITECEFPDKLKKSGVVPLYKKQDHLKKENYRPISLLPHVSKVFERILYAQINNYMQN